MQACRISDWRIHLDNGSRYMETARKGMRRPEVFNNDLILQLTAMAMESLLVSVWQYHGRMPCDHTLSGLVDGLAEFCPLEDKFIDSVKQIESFDDICALMPGIRRSPSDADITRLLDNGESLSRLVRDRLN